MLGRIYTNIKSFKTLQFIELYRIDEYVKDNNIPTLLISKKELLDRGYELSVTVWSLIDDSTLLI